MFRLSVLAMAGALVLATPAQAASVPDPAYLDSLAATLEAAPAPSRALDSKVLAALRQPLLVFEGRNLPSTAAMYTKYFASAETLVPRGWLKTLDEHPAGYYVSLDRWEQRETSYAGLTWGSSASSTKTATSGTAMAAACLRAWARIIRESQSINSAAL